MNITKEMCCEVVRDKVYSIPMVNTFVFAIVLFFIGFKTKEVGIILPLALIMLAVLVFLWSKAAKTVKNMAELDFFIVEDTVASFKKRIHLSRNISGYKYKFIFNSYGEYTILKNNGVVLEIPLNRKKHIKYSEVENHAISSCEAGDLFYLLVLNGKIVQAFNATVYVPLYEDFVIKDGKYYCK